MLYYETRLLRYYKMCYIEGVSIDKKFKWGNLIPTLLFPYAAGQNDF